MCRLINDMILFKIRKEHTPTLYQDGNRHCKGVYWENLNIIATTRQIFFKKPPNISDDEDNKTWQYCHCIDETGFKWILLLHFSDCLESNEINWQKYVL